MLAEVRFQKVADNTAFADVLQSPDTQGRQVRGGKVEQSRDLEAMVFSLLLHIVEPLSYGTHP